MPDTLTRKTTVTDGGDKAEQSDTVGYLIYFFFGLAEVLLAFRVVFKATGANPLSGFVAFVYSVTQLFILPFAGIFPQTTTQGAVTTAVLEPSTLVAMVVYAALAWGIAQFVIILSGKLES